MCAATNPEILIVDDERVVRKSLTAILEDVGYKVRTSNNGEEALSAILEKRPDLVILDVMMPKLDGFETCRRLRETDSTLPILFLTALETDASQIRALGLGGDDYIFKTATTDVILARVAAAIRRNEQREPTGDFSFGSWRIRPSHLEGIRADGLKTTLSEREIAILRQFASHPGEVMLKDWLAETFWSSPEGASYNVLTVTMHRLKAKLPPDGNEITNVRGCGYAYKRCAQ
jgi:two-component system response regulator MprA